MTRLAPLLNHPERLLNPLKVRAPELTLLPRAVAQIGGAARTINLEATEALQQRVAHLIAKDGAKALSRRDLRESCRTFLHPPHAPVNDLALAAPITDEVERLRRRSALFALLDAYLDGFTPDNDGVRWLAKRLDAMAAQWPWRDTDPWPARIDTFALLSPSEAGKRLALAVMNSQYETRAVLEAAGLTTEGRRMGGLGLAAFSAACQSARTLKADRAIPGQEKLVAWAGGKGPLAYPRAWPEFAAALFEPWRASDPPQKHKTLIIDKAVGYAGDPRINRPKWRPVEEAAAEAYGVILRWLTQTSVRQFFDIVNETTDRPDMWAARRTFWSNYLNAGMISAAWVAFGADGAARARRASERSNDKGLLMFGRLGVNATTGRTAQHAALIMTIGDLTIAEWSHNGKWNIWTRKDPRHPVLFRKSASQLPDYDPAELMNAPTTGSHMSGWQDKVAQIIKNQTGLRP